MKLAVKKKDYLTYLEVAAISATIFHWVDQMILQGFYNDEKKRHFESYLRVMLTYVTGICLEGIT